MLGAGRIGSSLWPALETFCQPGALLIRPTTLDFTELDQRRPRLETDLEGLPQREQALRERVEDAKRLLEPGPGVLERRPRGRLESCLPEIAHRLLAQVTPE